MENIRFGFSNSSNNTRESNIDSLKYTKQCITKITSLILYYSVCVRQFFFQWLLSHLSQFHLVIVFNLIPNCSLLFICSLNLNLIIHKTRFISIKYIVQFLTAFIFAIISSLLYSLELFFIFIRIQLCNYI